TVTMPTHRATRAPKINRDRTSRPNSSVPSKCTPPGGWSRSSSETMYGLYGARNGAKMAVKISTATITSPTTAARLRLSRNHARATFPRVGRCGTGTANGSAAESAIAHARIDGDVQHIDHQVDHAHHQRGDQHNALYKWIVTLTNGLDQQPPDAWP